MPRIDVGRLFHLHCWLIAAVTAGHVLSRLLYFARGQESSLTNVLNFGEESSIPTVASTAGLLAAALAAWLITADARAARTRLAWSWSFVAACLTFLAFDEGAALHDRLTFPVQRYFDLQGVFYLGWVLPYLVLVLVVAALCLPLAAQLPWPTLRRLAGAGALFVGAALGLEMVEALVISDMAGAGTAVRDADLATISRTPLMVALVTAEEIGEMLAVALLLRALLLHLVVDRGVAGIRLDAGVEEPGLQKDTVRVAQPRSALGKPL